MTQRFCPLCASEVEDLGGYCRLGHRLRLDAPQATLTELRDEVDRPFAESETVPDPVLVEVGAASAAARASAADLRGKGSANARASGESQPALPRSGGIDDPITAFAPPPRMDWGPPATWRSRLSRLRAGWSRTRRG